MSGPDPYAAPAALPAARPAALAWFRVYAAVFAVVDGALAFAAIRAAPGRPATLLLLAGALGVLALLHGVALVGPLRPWRWTLGLVLLATALPTVALPFVLPLLVCWRRPACRAAHRLF